MSVSTVTGVVRLASRIGVTSMGNPMWRIVIEDANGSLGEFRLSANSSLAGAIDNSEFRERAHVFTLTRAGRVDSARPLPVGSGE